MLEYHKDFIGPSNGFALLRDQLDWVRVGNRPRSEYWDTTLNEPYTYGSGPMQHTYQPQPSNPFISTMREVLFINLGVMFHGCFCNYYKHGKESLGWHSDDEPNIDHTKPIAILTFGGSRELQWKKMGTGGMKAISTQLLEDGSLALMPAGMQQTHLHRIPKASHAKGPVEPRISLTFRSLLE